MSETVKIASDVGVLLARIKYAQHHPKVANDLLGEKKLSAKHKALLAALGIGGLGAGAYAGGRAAGMIPGNSAEDSMMGGLNGLGGMASGGLEKLKSLFGGGQAPEETDITPQEADITPGM